VRGDRKLDISGQSTWLESGLWRKKTDYSSRTEGHRHDRETRRSYGRSSSSNGGRHRSAAKMHASVAAVAKAVVAPAQPQLPSIVVYDATGASPQLSDTTPPPISAVCRDWTTAIKELPYALTQGSSRLASPPPHALVQESSIKEVLPSSWDDGEVPEDPPAAHGHAFRPLAVCGARGLGRCP
jgi:hypothetical protein